MHRMADEILAIADQSTGDVAGQTGAGTQIINREHIERSRLRIETRKWLLSKLVRQIYGDAPATAGPMVNVQINMMPGDWGL